MDVNSWNVFAEQFGVSNILPIAQGGDGIISKLSKNVVGKVPSVFNRHGEIVGFKDWQQQRTTPAMLNKWASDHRYGLGVLLGQPLPAGGVAVCIDVDTEDEDHQKTVYGILRSALGVASMPQRVRDNSARRAYVLRITGADKPITKQVLKLAPNEATGKQEAVEILAYGQQFVACGHHPSGAALEWLDGPANDLCASVIYPSMTDSGQTLTAEQLAGVVEAIAAALPVQTVTRNAGRVRAAGEAGASDDVARYLDEQGYTLSIGPEGERRIRSPFADEYSTEQDDSDTSVIYYSAGTGKNATTGEPFARGHFVSLHASDAERSDDDFLAAIGYVASQFEQLPALPKSETPARAPRAFADLGAKGKVLATSRNVQTLLDVNGVEYGYDVVKKDIFINVPGLVCCADEYRNTAIVMIQDMATRAGMDDGRIANHVMALASTRPVNVFMNWVATRPWDGVSRLEALADTLKTGPDSDPALVRLLLRKWLVSVIASQRVEGFWSKGCLTLQGGQSKGKTSWFRRLFADVSSVFKDGLLLSVHNKDSKLEALAHVCVELGELEGTFKRSDIAGIKAFIQQSSDTIRRPYAVAPSTFQRRTVFCATVNDPEFLADDTGNSRFWCVGITEIDYRHDIDMQQLWAEVNALLDAGETWHLTPAEELRLGESNRQFELTDPLEEILRGRLNPDAPREWRASATEVLQNVAGVSMPTRSQVTKVAKVLSDMGYLAKKSNGRRFFELPHAANDDYFDDLAVGRDT